ncbi:uncharacterized protein LOC143199004 [Rhynchophorus ferrugineus]|uniref:uncharacterized protein LOC143199004 n=1 Tax=Rhynchophorus ferrugineus TaxID=354439 RepID=UPI003FCD549D
MKSTLVMFFFAAASMAVAGVIDHVIDAISLNYAETFPCGKPQPQVYTLREITGEEFTYDPPSVVLHRCDRAGCCLNDHESCQPDDIEDVYFLINVVDLDNIGTRRVKASNHTKCACYDTKSAIK